MHFVSLPIEILRTRPQAVFWLAAIAQALIWLFTPAFFYSALPGSVPELLSTARHFGEVALLAPPLAYWLADIAFLLAGPFGIYALSQICVVVTLWAVFALGREILGMHHAVLAILLMIGIYFFTIPTPDFSPSILIMPLWALALLFLWRAVKSVAGNPQQADPQKTDAQSERNADWRALAICLILLLLTSPLALLLTALVAGFIARHVDLDQEFDQFPFRAGAVFVAVAVAANLIWLIFGNGLMPVLPDPRNVEFGIGNLLTFANALGLLLIGHAGLAVMIAANRPYPSRMYNVLDNKVQSITLARDKESPLAASFIRLFALAPILLFVIAATIAGPRGHVGFAPVVILSGIFCLILAGPVVTLYRQRMLVLLWFAFLLAPPFFTVLTLALLSPWGTAQDLRANWPAQEMGRFFSDNFERRTGRKLTILTGDPALVPVIATAAPGQPFIFLPERTDLPQFLTANDIAEKGAIVVWRAKTNVEPPADLAARFPGLMAETPQIFERRNEGRLDPLRIGWAMIRPQKTAKPPAP